jgi:hypothetical protein
MGSTSGCTAGANAYYDQNCVKIVPCFAIVALLISGVAAPASARKKAAREPTPSKAEIEAATRLQIFLDRANFSPGKIDGQYGDFTWKALALYRESRGEQPEPPRRAKRNLMSLRMSRVLILPEWSLYSFPTLSLKQIYKGLARCRAMSQHRPN